MSKPPRLIAYADGSCLGNPGPGGWGVVLIGNDGTLEFSGAATSTTNNRMEITAAVEALRKLPSGVEVTIRTDSRYLVNTMTLGWKRRENLDLWKILDVEVAQRKVRWEWVRGHAGNPFNERADQLARNAALGQSQSPPLGHRTERVPTRAETPDTQPSGDTEPGRRVNRPLALSSEETAETENEDELEIARRLRPLLAADETLRRCAGCHRAFVVTGNPPRMRAYCSLAACQLKRRSAPSS
jgi:ribonuclease HI